LCKPSRRFENLITGDGSLLGIAHDHHEDFLRRGLFTLETALKLPSFAVINTRRLGTPLTVALHQLERDRIGTVLRKHMQKVGICRRERE
jgi:hypothetical protein